MLFSGLYDKDRFKIPNELGMLFDSPLRQGVKLPLGETMTLEASAKFHTSPHLTSRTSPPPSPSSPLVAVLQPHNVVVLGAVCYIVQSSISFRCLKSPSISLFQVSVSLMVLIFVSAHARKFFQLGVRRRERECSCLRPLRKVAFLDVLRTAGLHLLTRSPDGDGLQGS